MRSELWPHITDQRSPLARAPHITRNCVAENLLCELPAFDDWVSSFKVFLTCGVGVLRRLEGEASIYGAIVVAFLIAFFITTYSLSMANLQTGVARYREAMVRILEAQREDLRLAANNYSVEAVSSSGAAIVYVIIYRAGHGDSRVLYINSTKIEVAPGGSSLVYSGSLAEGIASGYYKLAVITSRGNVFLYTPSSTGLAQDTPQLYTSWDPIRLRSYLQELLSQGRYEELIATMGSLDYVAMPYPNYLDPVLGVSFRREIVGDYGSATQILIARNTSSAKIHMADWLRCYTAQQPDDTHSPWPGAELCGGSSIIVFTAYARDTEISASAWEPRLVLAAGLRASYDPMLRLLSSSGSGNMVRIGSVDPSQWLSGGQGGNATAGYCAFGYSGRLCWSSSSRGLAGGSTGIVASYSSFTDLINRILNYSIDLWILRAVGGYEDFPFAQQMPEHFATMTVFNITPQVSGAWGFAIDSDDAGDVIITGPEGNRAVVATFYGAHGTWRSPGHSGNITLSAGASYTVIVRQQQGFGGRAVGLYIMPPGAGAWIPLDAFGIEQLRIYASITEIVMSAWSYTGPSPRTTEEMDSVFRSLASSAPAWRGPLRSVWLAGGGSCWLWWCSSTDLQMRFQPSPPPFSTPLGGPSGGLGGWAAEGNNAAVGGSGGGGGGLALLYASEVAGSVAVLARGGLGGAGSNAVDVFGSGLWDPGLGGAGGIAVVIYSRGSASLTADASGSVRGYQAVIYDPR